MTTITTTKYNARHALTAEFPDAPAEVTAEVEMIADDIEQARIPDTGLTWTSGYLDLTINIIAEARMPGVELQTIREWLGLTTDSLATILGVRHDTVRRWESGREPIPYRVHDELQPLVDDADSIVAELRARLADGGAVDIYRTDREMHAARPDLAHLPARWWRMIVARATHGLDGVRIGQHRARG